VANIQGISQFTAVGMMMQVQAGSPTLTLVLKELGAQNGGVAAMS
jgi:hypothetical protein